MVLGVAFLCFEAQTLKRIPGFENLVPYPCRHAAHEVYHALPGNWHMAWSCVHNPVLWRIARCHVMCSDEHLSSLLFGMSHICIANTDGKKGNAQPGPMAGLSNGLTSTVLPVQERHTVQYTRANSS